MGMYELEIALLMKWDSHGICISIHIKIPLELEANNGKTFSSLYCLLAQNDI